MGIFFLDAGGAGLFGVVIGLGVLFLAVTIVIEALVMTVMKYNIFKKALLHSAVCNLVSVAAGAILISLNSETFNIDNVGGFTAMLGVTLVVEFFILYGFNREKPVARTALVCVIMNLATYIILFLIARYR